MKVLSLVLFYLISTVVSGAESPSRKVFFANSIMPDSYYYSKATHDDKAWVKNFRGQLPVTTNAFTPGNALELEYSGKDGGEWRAFVYYHQIRGIDTFLPATHLVFRLLADANTTIGLLPRIAIGQRNEAVGTPVAIGKYINNFRPGEWLTVSIPLSELTDLNEDKLDQILFIGGTTNNEVHRVIVDQIELEGKINTVPITQVPQLVSAKGYERHIDLVWGGVNDVAIRYVKVYRSINGKDFRPIGIQSPYVSRYADYTGEVNKRYWYRITFIDDTYNETPASEVRDATTRELSDDELLDMVQEAHFRYYWEGAEPNSGLALENIPGRRDMVASGASGFGVMAIVAAANRKYITRDQAVKRFLKIISFLDKADKFHGAFSHFIDGPSGKVEPFFGPRDNGGDLVETSFLMQGLLAAQQYFNGPGKEEKAIRDGISKLWRNVEWKWYRRLPDNPFLVWHWSPDKEWIINHHLIGWNETMITYFLAISSPTYGVPASMYYSGWASQLPEAEEYRMNWGKTEDGSRYTNGKYYYGVQLPVGVSNGGPLFFIHYSYLGLNPHAMNDAYTNYYVNNRNIALINYRYCVANPENHRGYGPGCWGITASDGPTGYSANEPVPAADEGKITPTGALASFPYTPDESMLALKTFYRTYGHFLWGEFGFRDAFILEENWCSEIFMGLNQAPIAVMIENYRSGLLWELFMAHPDVKNALKKIESENVRQKR